MESVPGRRGTCKPLIQILKPKERGERPPPCGRCNAAAWWNGWRWTFPVVWSAASIAFERWEQPVPRAKCAAGCGSFTVYPPGIYPRRQYQLDAVADVAGGMALGRESGREAGERVGASRTSAERWTRHVAQVAKPEAVLAVTARLDPDAPAGAGIATRAPEDETPRGVAARVLAALEQLGVALVRRGVALVERSGLSRVLGWQHRAHGVVVSLTVAPCRLSPPMVLGGLAAAP